MAYMFLFICKLYPDLVFVLAITDAVTAMCEPSRMMCRVVVAYAHLVSSHLCLRFKLLLSSCPRHIVDG